MTTQTRRKEGEKQSGADKKRRSSVRGQGHSASRPEQTRERTDPSSKAHPLLHLQRSHGNRAVQRMLEERRSSPEHPELAVGRPNDTFEREADRVAEQVTSASTPSGRHTHPSAVSREHVQHTATHPQRRHDEAESLGSSEGERGIRRGDSSSETPTLDTETAELIRASRTGGHALPDSVRSEFEPTFGHDFGGVRVHTGTRADEAARAVDARAFTLGRDIVFSSGAYRPEEAEGKRLLAHELTHVLQQRAGDARIQREEETKITLGTPEPSPFGGPRVDVRVDQTSGHIYVKIAGTTIAEAAPLQGRDYRFNVTDEWSSDQKSLDISIDASPGLEWWIDRDGVEAVRKRFPSITLNITDGREPISIEEAPKLQFDLESGYYDPFRDERGESASAGFRTSRTGRGEPASDRFRQSRTERGESKSGGILTTISDLATDFIPGVSNVKDAYTALTGVNPVTGEKVGVLGRIAAGIFAIPGVGNVAKYIGKGGKLVGKGLLWAGRKLGKPLAKAGRWGLKKAKGGWNWLKKKLGFGKKPESSGTPPRSLPGRRRGRRRRRRRVNRPRLPRGKNAPRLPSNRFRRFSEPLRGPLAERQRRIMQEARTNPQQAGRDYERLIAEDLRGEGVREAFPRPGRRPDIGTGHEVTIEGRTRGFSTHKLDQFWIDMRDTDEILLTVPQLSDSARDQLLRLGAQAEQEFNKEVLIIIRETLP